MRSLNAKKKKSGASFNRLKAELVKILEAQLAAIKKARRFLKELKKLRESGEMEGFLTEAKAQPEGYLPSIMEYQRHRGPTKKRLKRERIKLLDHWYGSGWDIPRNLQKEAEDLVDGIESDMGAEWEDSGYSYARIVAASYGTAMDMRPDLKWLLNILQRYDKWTWKDMPERW